MGVHHHGHSHNTTSLCCLYTAGLQEYDDHLKAIVSEITNIHYPNESPSWSQATLPVRSGQVQCLLSEVTAHKVHLRGCGVGYKKHCASTTISLSDFAASTDLVHCILTSMYVMFLFPAVRKLSHSGQRVTATRP